MARRSGGTTPAARLDIARHKRNFDLKVIDRNDVADNHPYAYEQATHSTADELDRHGSQLRVVNPPSLDRPVRSHGRGCRTKHSRLAYPLNSTTLEIQKNFRLFGKMKFLSCNGLLAVTIDT